MQSIISQIADLARKQKQSQNFIDFAEIFYAECDAKDFENYKLEELVSLALDSFKFFENRNSEQTKIRIDNSHLNKDRYSIIEIVNDDMPFLVDSIACKLDSLNLEIKNVMHPIYRVLRDKSGVVSTVNSDDKSAKIESVIQYHTSKINASDIDLITKEIAQLLENIKLVVQDWPKMTDSVRNLQQQTVGKKSAQDTAEIKDFINWLCDGNFIFLGFKEFNLKKDKSGLSLDGIDSSALGVFRSKHSAFIPNVVNSSVEELEKSMQDPFVVEILKSRYKSQIHRRTNAERIRIQKFSSQGELVGEYRIIGLFTSQAYSVSPQQIPLIKGKIAEVIQKSGFVKGSHNYKDLISVIDSYPRDELFQISAQDLLRIASGIVMICGRNQVRYFARQDKYNRFVSCLVYTPRERSNSDLREKIRDYLAKEYNGEVVDTFVQITESNLTRLHVIIRTDRKIDDLAENKIENAITEIATIWSDSLKEEIVTKFGEDNAVNLFAKYKKAFTVSYSNRFDARRAAIDISRIEDCLNQNSILFNLYKSSTVEQDVSELKIYSPNRELILSDVMPILESFGFNVIHEHTYVASPEGTKDKVWIHYFRINLNKSGAQFNDELKKNFEETMTLIWQQVMSAGSLNQLLVSSALTWKEIYVLRAYSKYLYQSGFRHDQKYVANILVKNSAIAKLLIELFSTKFDPALQISLENRKKKIEEISEKIKNELNKVSDASHDLAIRKYLGLINATLRTNYYQTDANGNFKGYLSFKFDCKNVPDLPLPLPYAEIFVYSSAVEGVHLRGGRVARGGLRWSDRHEDFRTEVLGLMKAQMTKNAVIVPVGSKGGFVVKKDATKLSREEYLKEGIQCYKTFLRGLLDLTDNVINTKIIHPQNVIMYDDSDPYLVVAADKGTATFSDIANSVSAEYNFWLGDAFASGGSVGYDHKKMGITAKGAWISVKRHFAEMNHDTQSQDFTCVGIGDLAGDVFGNGMLLSKHIRLVAAFNHMHIFLDPNPDAAKSFVERERMFNLPRSSWLDYDKSLISKGGGIYERSAKSIQITPEVKQILAIDQDEMTPNQLINAILKAPVDLLWNGGIGTYVKAIDETNLEVGDRANDAFRINGSELRCKVVGEGGNLGFTQKGRIEYALNGGRINTDAMDNSAGVDCSDHEVNIKIAMTQAMRANKITLEKRNKILESMTDNVSELVLADNRLQTQAITIAQSQGASALASQSQFLDHLEKTGLLNRKIEFLPSSKEIQKRQLDKVGLTRPELCVMLAYAKMDIYNQLLTSDLIDDKYFESELLTYFPDLMQKDFKEEILTHQLRREIIATQLTNFIINRTGINFISQIRQESGFALVDVIKCFIIACDSYGLRKIWDEIENIKNVNVEAQAQMFLSANRLLERSILWLLRNQPTGDLTAIVGGFKKIASQLSEILPEVLAQASKESFERKIDKYIANKAPKDLADKLAAMDPIASAFDIAEISAKSKFDLKKIAKIYFIIGSRFSLKWLRSRLQDISSDSYWQKLSIKTVLEDLYSYQLKLALNIVSHECNKGDCAVEVVDSWIKESATLVERYDNFILDLKAHPSPDMSMFVVALNRLKPLVN